MHHTSVSVTPTIVWFRQDLRLQDNPALQAAIARGGVIVPVYIRDDDGEWGWKPGAASRWWLHHSLTALEASLRAKGSRLVVRRGDTERVLRALVSAVGAGAVYWNRGYEPPAIAREGWLQAALAADGVEVQAFNASLLHEPESIANKQGRPFQVFGPFWRYCLEQPVASPQRLSTRLLPAPKAWPPSVDVRELDLLPSGGWDGNFYRAWQPGEIGAGKRLRAFVSDGMANYFAARDLLSEDGTSRLSPHLHFGEISPRQVWAAVRAEGRARGIFPPNKGAAVFLNEIGWREFAHHLLCHFPHTPEFPLRAEFANFPWAADPDGNKLRAWQQGRTGYPIVDAAMRQLWSIGWMHNRARMIVASFLVKHLRLPWQRGAEWFWDTLVDADLANNTLGWQWSAGSGADATPYFRIFSPLRQGLKFDSEGEYVRRWVPELAQVPAKFIHAPWTAPASALKSAGVALGKEYPFPLVDHATARREALAAFKQLRVATA